MPPVVVDGGAEDTLPIRASCHTAPSAMLRR